MGPVETYDFGGPCPDTHVFVGPSRRVVCVPRRRSAILGLRRRSFLSGPTTASSGPDASGDTLHTNRLLVGTSRGLPPTLFLPPTQRSRAPVDVRRGPSPGP